MSQYAKKNTNPTKTIETVGQQTVKRKAARHVSGKHGRISLVIFYSRSSSFKLLYYYSFVFFCLVHAINTHVFPVEGNQNCYRG